MLWSKNGTRQSETCWTITKWCTAN